MRKTLTATLAAALIAGAAVAMPSDAQARGGWVPGALIGGLAAGAIIGGAAAAASAPYYGPYGYYGPAPAYAYGPGCVIRHQRVWTGWAWRWQPVRVCY